MIFVRKLLTPRRRRLPYVGFMRRSAAPSRIHIPARAHSPALRLMPRSACSTNSCRLIGEISKERLAMTQDQQSEPPSWLRPPLFMVGQDRRGNWVVQEQKGMCGGLFISREAALRYVRSENEYKPRAVVMVSGDFELEMNNRAGASLRESPSDPANRRRIA
jgi:hypothetical protein